jgi:hypothetical protein
MILLSLFFMKRADIYTLLYFFNICFSLYLLNKTDEKLKFIQYICIIIFFIVCTLIYFCHQEDNSICNNFYDTKYNRKNKNICIKAISKDLFFKRINKRINNNFTKKYKICLNKKYFKIIYDIIINYYYKIYIETNILLYILFIFKIYFYWLIKKYFLNLFDNILIILIFFELCLEILVYLSYFF